MPGICGWVADSGIASEGLTDLKQLAAGLSPDTTIASDSIIVGNHTAIAVCPAEDNSGIAKSGSTIVAIHGNYRWLDQDISATLSEIGPGQALVRAFQKFGDSLLDRLSGAFSLAIVDDESGELFMATDRFATKPIAYFQRNGVCVFASNTNALRRHHLFRDELNPDAIFCYLFFHTVPLPVGIYRGVDRLPPGTAMRRTSTGTQLLQYHEICFDNSFKNRKSDELATEIKSHLQLAIDTLAQNVSVGAFLSGGIDSSTITALLSGKGNPAQTYSIGFDEKGYDEMNFARIVARRFGSDHHEYYVTPQDVVDAIPNIAASYAEPFGNASAVPTYYCARMAKNNGIQRLLGGDGGDELFGGNQRYAYQKMLSAFMILPGPIRTLLSAIFRNRGDSSWRVVQKASSYIDKASIPLPGRLYTDNLLDTIGAGVIVTPEFLEQAATGLPQRLVQDRYAALRTRGTLNKLLGLDWHFALACSDLPKVSRMCELAGVDVAFPFLENNVVEFSSHLPDESKVRRLQLRYFFKQAVSDLLPEVVLKKTKHGFGMPFGVWISQAGPLRDFTLSNLEALRTRGVIQPRFIDNLIQTLLPRHSQYYGVMAWLLLMLEQFYQAHVDCQR